MVILDPKLNTVSDTSCSILRTSTRNNSIHWEQAIEGLDGNINKGPPSVTATSHTDDSPRPTTTITIWRKTVWPRCSAWQNAPDDDVNDVSRNQPLTPNSARICTSRHWSPLCLYSPNMGRIGLKISLISLEMEVFVKQHNIDVMLVVETHFC